MNLPFFLFKCYMKLSILLLLFILPLSSCINLTSEPHRGRLNIAARHKVDLLNYEILSQLDKVKKTNDNELYVKDGGKVSIGAWEKTNFVADVTVDCQNVGLVRMTCRSTPFDFKNNLNKELQIEIGEYSAKLLKNQTVLAETAIDRLNKGDKLRVQISNFGNKMTVYLDCNQAFSIEAYTSNTSYIIIETEQGGEYKFNGIEFADYRRTTENF